MRQHAEISFAKVNENRDLENGIRVVLGDHSLDYTIPAEIRLPQIYHKRGALAAAREPDMVNPKPKVGLYVQHSVF